MAAKRALNSVLSDVLNALGLAAGSRQIADKSASAIPENHGQIVDKRSVAGSTPAAFGQKQEWACLQLRGSASPEQWQRLISSSLIGHGEVLQTFQRVVRVFVRAHRKRVEATAAHVEQLITQHVANRA